MMSQKILVDLCASRSTFTVILLDLLPKLLPALRLRHRTCYAAGASMAELLQKAMRSMALDDEEPLTLPDDPRFRVFDENAISILGKLSNPESQPMDKMIGYMPEAWRVYDRVRGIALSRDRFQFVFEREEDLLRVLKDRPWSYQGWTLLLERWSPNPPEDFLNSLEFWIRIRNIPVNHFTTDTMFRLASEIGEVKEIAYDPKVSQTTEYIRACVCFNIANPAKEKRKLTIPSGDVVLIEYEYERIHKKCFHCLRLTHEKYRCPLLGRGSDKLRSSPGFQKPQLSSRVAPSVSNPPLGNLQLEAPPGFPPLFPELSAEDRKMALQYISHADETERLARILRVKQSIEENAAESSARLIKITSEIDKGKGHVFDYKHSTVKSKRSCLNKPQPAASAPILDGSSDGESFTNHSVDHPLASLPGLGTTDFLKGLSNTSSSDTLKAGKKVRRRPSSWQRKLRSPLSASAPDSIPPQDLSPMDVSAKRKISDSPQSAQNKTPKTQSNTVASDLKPL